MRFRREVRTARALALALATVTATVTLASGVLIDVPSVGATSVSVNTLASLQGAFADTTVTEITLTADIPIPDCPSGVVGRGAPAPVVTIIGNGHAIHQACAVNSVFLDGGSGIVLDGLEVSGGSAIVQSAGSITLTRSRVHDAKDVGVLASGSVTMTDSEVDHISSAYSAIGVESSHGATLTRSTIHDVSAAIGDATGLYMFGLVGGAPEPVTIASSSITDITSTSATAYGVRNTTTGNVVTDSSITDVMGGIAYGITGVDLAIARSTIAHIEGGSATTSLGIAMFSTVSATNVTIVDVGDAAFGVTGILPAGGMDGFAIFSPTMSLVYSTVTNTPGISAPTQLTMFGSVVAQSHAGSPNCAAGTTVSSAGYNFADDLSCSLTATGDGQGAGLDPQLATLADNGGPGLTRLPTAGSPLLDAIPIDACQSGPAAGVVTDERGVARPQGTGCDIGAVEVVVVQPVVPAFTG